MFTLQQTLKTTVGYPEYQIIIDGQEVDVNVTFEAQAITFLSGNRCDVVFGVTIENIDASGSFNFQFQYDGTGNPLSVAEDILKEELILRNSQITE
ncbi:hypothetical protein VBQ76_18755 [Klebsiella pneumoniae]|nr:hypothetical protein [Klebsiella pneumoniae]